MKIGNLNVEGLVFCAPMAGISTPPYRLFARRFGAAVVYTEMVSSHGLVYKSKKTKDLLDFSEIERPLGIQLFGADPEIMNRAAGIVAEWNPDIIDLNFGCPVKKVVKKNGGAAVLKDLGLTRALVEAAVSASDIPVTTKLRSGWDETTKVFAEAGKVCEKAGAKAITLHARTRSKQFGGRACWDDIKKLKETVGLPVIGNGDITCGKDAARMLEETGCDAVMVGRAAMGNPWIFREINHYLDTGNQLPLPTLDEKIAIILEHARMLIKAYNESSAMLKMRHHVAWYAKGWPGVAAIRLRAYKMTTFSELETILNDYRAGIIPEDEESGHK
jgi:nifR3 family TIM-barrel protein